jgi:phosphomannomutase
MKKEPSNFKNRVNVCFGKNDLRCIAGKELDSEIAYRTGKAIVQFLKAKNVIVGHDMRISSHKLKNAFIRGIQDQGANAINIGEVDSPSLYFASGFLNLPGGMITASHNPAKYNGIKLVNSGARPIGENTGIKKIQEIVQTNKFSKTNNRGKVIKKDLSKEYRKHVQSFSNINNITNFKVVIDAGNGMGGKMVSITYKGIKIKIKKLGFKRDGSFPKHDANPAIPKNLKHLQKYVKKDRADLGIAFDGDMDRVFFVDEKGKAVDPSIIAALIITHLPSKKTKGIVYNVSMSKIVPETAIKCDFLPLKEKVGHAFIKARMKKTKSEFGAENSAHYYYKGNYFADSGLISSLIILEIFSDHKQKGQTFSQILVPYQKYVKIPEKSLKVKDKSKIINKIQNHYQKKAKKIDKLDGLTLEFEDYWFNIRPSNTEQLLRINLEADSKKVIVIKSRELIDLIQKFDK